MKIAFYTLGCKVNQYETEVMREKAQEKGFTVTEPDASFDVLVINSCTVTAESDRKVRQTLRHYRRKNPSAVIVLTGCMVQAFPNESGALGEADIIIGNRNISEIVEKVEEFLANKTPLFEIIPHKNGDEFNTPSIYDFAERTRAYIKIEDGCNRYCSYCIIPYARGFVRSKPIAEIEKEAQVLANKGFSEIVLTGINLSAYKTEKGENLCDAVTAAAKPLAIKRVRLGSLEPDHITDKMLERFKAEPKFCPQFHLSLQSGCDATLKRMNRHYDSAFYEDLVIRIRKAFESAAITTDIMVGFAGETESEFSESLAFAKKIGFARAHIFAYSRRKGTVAYKMPNQVEKSEKARRSKLMIEATTHSERGYIENKVSQMSEVLFETKEKGFWQGYTPDYVLVKVKTDENLAGQIRKVKITSAENDFCYGEINVFG